MALAGVVIGAVASGGLNLFTQHRAFINEKKSQKNSKSLEKLEELVLMVEDLGKAVDEAFGNAILYSEGGGDLVKDGQKTLELSKLKALVAIYAPELISNVDSIIVSWERHWGPAYAAMIGVSKETKSVRVEKNSKLAEAHIHLSAEIDSLFKNVPKLIRERGLV